MARELRHTLVDHERPRTATLTGPACRPAVLITAETDRAEDAAITHSCCPSPIVKNDPNIVTALTYPRMQWKAVSVQFE
jgi:hypothetical protein